MFKKLFNIKSEEEIAREKLPRRIPDAHRDGFLANDDSWVVSMEFRDQTGKAGYDRIYRAASRQKDGSWNVYNVTYNLADDKISFVSREAQSSASAMVRSLYFYDRAMKDKEEFKLVEGTYQTYRDAAARHGYLFDAAGDLYAPNIERPFMREVAVPIDRLKQVFRDSAEKMRMDNWADYYDRVITAAEENAGVSFKELSADPYYRDFVKQFKNEFKVMTDLEKYMASDAESTYRKLKVLESIENYTILDTKGFATTAHAKAAQYIVDLNTLTSLIRAGGAVARKPMSVDGTINLDHLELMQALGKTIYNFACNRLGVDTRIANKMRDLILAGADPHGPALPVEKMFADFPPIDPPTTQVVYVPGKGNVTIETSPRKAAVKEGKAEKKQKNKNYTGWPPHN